MTVFYGPEKYLWTAIGWLVLYAVTGLAVAGLLVFQLVEILHG